MNNAAGTFREEHVAESRRWFLKLAAAGVATLPGWVGAAPGKSELEKLIDELEFFTPPLKFGTVDRTSPYELPIEERRRIGLERETWKLEVVPDKDTAAEVENPLSAATGNAFTFAQLMALAETKSVKYLKLMTCNNSEIPLGMGLWEGVPLRDVVWKSRPVKRVRRIHYNGYQTPEDPFFRSSLPIGRVLEDPPGLDPVILAYKLNGDWIPGIRGGPVRLIVPESYGFKSVKWLTHVFLTDLWHANDTYAHPSPNDIDSMMKTYARFVHYPGTWKAGDPLPLTGYAQVGMSGLTKVQYWITSADTKLQDDDPYFTQAPWKDAEILPPPKKWKQLPGETLPADVSGFSREGVPDKWPLNNSLAHWAMLTPPLPPGKYHLRCRTLDRNGTAQPMPRPFKKSGRNFIERMKLTVEA